MLSVQSKEERRFPESLIVLNLGVAATVHTTLLVKGKCNNGPVVFLIIIMIRMEVHTL